MKTPQNTGVEVPDSLNLDRTFCASPDCDGSCGRQWTDAHEAASKRVSKPYISFGYFCGQSKEHF